MCSYNQGVTPPAKNKTQKHAFNLFKSTLLSQVDVNIHLPSLPWSNKCRRRRDVHVCYDGPLLSRPSFPLFFLLSPPLNGKIKHHKSSLSVICFMLGNYTQSAAALFGLEHSDVWRLSPLPGLYEKYKQI